MGDKNRFKRGGTGDIIRLIPKINDIVIILSFLILASLFSVPIMLSGNGIMAYGEISHISTDNAMQLKTMGEYGQYPMWNNYLSMGMPLYPQPDGNMYYPFINPFYAALGILNGMFAIIIFHLFLAGVGFWYFSKYLSDNVLSRYFGSTLFMFAGANIIRISWGHIIMYCAYSWIPIALYFMHTAVKTRKIEHAVLASISILMMLLIGVYIFFFFFIIFVSYAFFNIVKIHSIWKPKISLDKHNLLLLSLIFIVVLGISAIKVLPMFYYNSLAEREVFGLYASMSGGNLLTYFISKQGAVPASGGFELEQLPYAFIGIIPMFFLPFAVLSKNSQKNYLFLSSALLFLWGMGFYTVAGVAHLLPVAAAIRAPERVLIPLSFTLVALSVLGFDYIRKKKPSKVLLLLLIIVIGLELITPFLFYVVLPANYEGYSAFTASYLDLTILALGIIATATVAFVLWFLYRPSLKIANLINLDRLMVYVALFAVFNIFVVNINVMGGDEFKEKNDVSQGIIDIVKQDTSDDIVWVNITEPHWPFRLNQPYFVDRDVHIASGLRGTSKAWYREFKPEWNVDIGNTTYFTYDYEASLMLLNSSQYIFVDSFTVSVKWENYTGDIEPSAFSEFSESQFKKTVEQYNITIYVHEVVNRLPDAFIVRDDTVIPQNITYYSPNKIKVKVNGQKGDRVVVRTSYYPGWKYGRGDEFRDAGSYKRMISFSLDADGEREYTVLFDPPDFYYGAVITIVTILIMCAFVIYKKSLIQKILSKAKKTDDAQKNGD
jgi:hypothetical protein